MFQSLFLATAWLTWSTAAFAPGFKTASSSAVVCAELEREFPANTLQPSDAAYVNETEFSWHSSAWLKAGCVFIPSTPQHVSAAVTKLSKYKTKFAVRGGGHMPIDDAANIGASGVLISSTNLRSLVLSADKSTLSVGVGNSWGHVYEYLEGTGVAVVGGRIGPIGVPGLLLGGGISFYANEKGFASANGNVKAVECVLANGNIITATASNRYSDLYWALQGGGNSFCIATRFDLRTFPIEATMVGDLSFGNSSAARTGWIDSVYTYVTNGHKDVKTHVLPIARLSANGPSKTPEFSSTLFYNGNNTKPAIFNDFLGGKLNSTTNARQLNPLTQGQFSRFLSPNFRRGGGAYGAKHAFQVLPVMASKEAIDVVLTSYFAAFAAELIPTVANVSVSLAFNSLTKNFLSVSRDAPQGVDLAPQFWVEESITWTSIADDEKVHAFARKMDKELPAKLKAIGKAGKYLYLNDASEDQAVFESYGTVNLNKLKSIRTKYDSGSVFTDLLPGGFKVAKARG